MSGKLMVYNTMSKEKEEFVPLKAGEVNMYVCGPTTYNYIHLGNARPIVVFDTVRRYLEYKGYRVNYIQNFTDVDDKIINHAKEENDEPLALAARYIEAFYEDVSDIIRHGKSTIYRTEDIINFRHPKGTQAVIRYSDKGNRALIVYHTFENPKKLEFELDGKWEIERALYPAKISIDSKATIDESKKISGNVILLKRRK